jgi:hypothetical protein
MRIADFLTPTDLIRENIQAEGGVRRANRSAQVGGGAVKLLGRFEQT